MGFDLQWWLLALPITFVLGWLASRWDVRQWRSEQQESPRAYFKGLNLLLNEQQDKAIDAFIEAVQQEPGTSDLHFALGNLFRRRGEYERAVRVHQHLLSRADLKALERERAQYALAQDFLKAGLFDRAQEAYAALESSSTFGAEARLALLTLHERSRDWTAAQQAAAQLETGGAGSFSTRIAHHWCEVALDAMAAHDMSSAATALDRARQAAPDAARPWVLRGELHAAQGQHPQAMSAWEELVGIHPTVFNLVATSYADSAKSCDAVLAARLTLETLAQRHPSFELTQALAALDGDVEARCARWVGFLTHRHSLTAAHQLLEQRRSHNKALLPPEMEAVDTAVALAARSVHRYRCAACGFEAQRYFWQCPGCHGWDTYPPKRLEDQ